MKRVLLLATLLLAVGLCVALAGFGLQAWRYLHTPLELPDRGVVLEIPAGLSAAGVAKRLQAAGIIERPDVFSRWARLSGKAARLQAGEYVFNPGVTPRGILAILEAGNVMLHPLTLLEGWSWREVRDAITASDFITVTLDYSSPEALAGQLALGAGHIEGRLFPDTYTIARGTTDREVLQLAARLMERKLQAAWDDRAPDLPLGTPAELLTLASIIERETSVDSERAQVAGVLVRRLQQGMRLQTDPTVIYGMGDNYRGNISRRDLQTDTPYNTYTRAGLPPTPIAMPGEASLLAAANPAPGDALFFVASPALDGTHVFSATLEAHNAAVAAYIAGLRRGQRAREPGAGAKPAADAAAASAPEAQADEAQQ